MATNQNDGHTTKVTTQQTQSATDANKTLFRSFYERAWNEGGDPAVVDRYLSPNFANHMLPSESTNHREHYRQAILENRRLFPDYTLTLTHVIAENDLVAAHWRTHCTVGAGAPPGLAQGTPIDTSGMTLVRITDGQITDFWKYDNAATVLAQAMAQSSGQPQAPGTR